jgi:hypothetical protein
MIIMRNTRRYYPAADRAWYAATLSRYTTKRRAQLGLSVKEAAELSGMQVCEWAAMEDGWIPTDVPTIRAIAQTLSIRWPDLDLLVWFARSAQQDVA